ncbi:hypothetical protein LIER_39256 [Lithospermum erythrorhizon]|uniref:Uncharacterized protein n=1 Tax=Lithospermum erythrorhizon TaxID=34254 RepID=A0AAV3QEA3_LITER
MIKDEESDQFPLLVEETMGRGRLGYGRLVTTGHPYGMPIDIPPPSDLDSTETGRWCSKLVASGDRQTLAIIEWLSDQI